MAGFIYFTEEQKEQVREIDLVAYLKKNGYKLKKAGSDYVWESPQGKVSVRGKNHTIRKRKFSRSPTAVNKYLSATVVLIC